MISPVLRWKWVSVPGPTHTELSSTTVFPPLLERGHCNLRKAEEPIQSHVASSWLYSWEIQPETFQSLVLLSQRY